MRTNRSLIVVGVDGSAGAESALEWALEYARSAAAPVRRVYAFARDVNYVAVSGYGSMPVPDLAQIEANASKLLADAAARAVKLAPEVSVDVRAVNDDPVRILLEESKQAATIVLGTRHLGAVGSAVLGSVGASVSARADCPVVITRGPAGMAAEDAEVVVGVDATAGAEAVLAYGFEFARLRSVPLRVVMCSRPDLLAEMMWRSEPPIPQRAEANLSEALAGWREEYPEVVVHSAVIRDHAVDGLVAASAAQHLLVVGAHGRHALAGTLLGSVSQGVLHHATCPVAVIPLPD
jgi:nucleotide-binding universal stress UspA family protein